MTHAVTDEQAKKIIEKYAHCRNLAEFQSLDEMKKERNNKRIYEKGLSIRQISRLTGTTKGMVEKNLKALGKDKEPPLSCGNICTGSTIAGIVIFCRESGDTEPDDHSQSQQEEKMRFLLLSLFHI